MTALAGVGFGLSFGGLLAYLIVHAVLQISGLLTLVPPDTAPPPQERWLSVPMQRVAQFSMRHAGAVLGTLLVGSTVAIAGIWHLRVDTNHINFFGKNDPLHQSAAIIDRQAGPFACQRASIPLPTVLRSLL